MNSNKPKILILSSDTGGGHRSAAAAIVAGVQSFFKGESYAIRVIRLRAPCEMEGQREAEVHRPASSLL